MVMHTFYPREAEAGRSLRAGGQSCLHSETLSPEKQNKTKATGIATPVHRSYLNQSINNNNT